MRFKIIFVLLAMLCIATTVDARKKDKKKASQEVKLEKKDSKYEELFKDKACE